MVGDLPEPILRLAERCHEAGGRAFLVGGCVRDGLLGIPVKDWDIEVFGIPENALFKLLRRIGSVNSVGRSFGVFKLGNEIDVSLPRRDSKVGAGHRGIAVEGDPNMSTFEAARRRDLTINAILLDPRTGTIEDPHGGRRDLEAKLLRAVDGDTFLEDPLRALRVVQFAARLGFHVDPELITLCRQAALSELPAERIQGEWLKFLLRGQHLEHGLAVARRADLLRRVFPEAALADAPDVGPSLDRLVSACRRQSPEGRAWVLMLAAWLQHADHSAVEKTLDRLWLHKWKGYPLRKTLLDLHAAWSSVPTDDAALRNLSARAELGLCLHLQEACMGVDNEANLSRAEALGILHEPPRALLQGRDLIAIGRRPGPWMGELLSTLYQRQLDGQLTTRDEAMAAAQAMLAASSQE